MIFVKNGTKIRLKMYDITVRRMIQMKNVMRDRAVDRQEAMGKK